MPEDAQSPREFVTPRLRLRRLTDADLPFLVEVHQGAILAEFIPSAIMTTEDQARAFIERGRTFEDPRNEVGRRFGWWCSERRDGTPVGVILFKPIPASWGYDQHDIEIGWRTHPAHQGNGYATDAARVVLDWALASGPDRVVAVVHPDNVASQRVCAHLGMTHLGRSRAYYDEELELFEARGKQASTLRGNSAS